MATGEPPGETAPTDGRHIPTGRESWLLGLPLAVLFSAAGYVLPHTQPVLVRAAAAVLLGAACLEVAWRESDRRRLTWGRGGVSYRLGWSSGALQWRDLTVNIWQGQEVEISGFPWTDSGVAHDAPKRKAITIGSSRTATRGGLRFWPKSSADLIRAIELAHEAATAAGCTTAPPLLPPARRPIALWITWAAVTALIVVPLGLRGAG
jgi:hypothetical protein